MSSTKKRVKARLMCLYDDGYYTEGFSDLPSDDRKNHYCIPADQYEAMIKTMHTAYCRGFGVGHPENGLPSIGRLRRALQSVGIKPLK